MTRWAHETAHVRVGPMRLRVRVTGDGPPLLLLMGLGGNLDMWEPLAAELPGRQLVMFDHPGTGGSTNPWLPATMAHNAWLANRVIRALGHRTVDVLGYSWGGLVAQHLAAQHRASVRRLVLACTTIGWGGCPPPLRVAAMMATPRRYYSRSYFRRVAPTLYGGRFRTDRSLADHEFGHRLTHPPTGLGYLAQLGAAVSYSSLPVLPLISAPTLVLAGDDDPIIPSCNPRLLASLLRRGRLEVIPGGGHLLLLDRSRDAAAAIESFLAE
jgi:pimeloyl-ACP methyl ester carboxylesterase